MGLTAHPALAQVAGCTRDAMIVFDGSGSMAESGSLATDPARIFEARAALARAMPRVASVRRIGLVVYGPGGGDSCSNIDTRFSPIREAAPRILADLGTVEPAGKTPLTQAIQQAADVLDYRQRPGVVVLVTDGRETCGGTPCRLADALSAEAPGLTVHVIGFKVRGDAFDLLAQPGSGSRDGQSVARCLAERTGGLYVAAESVDQLVGALMQTLGCTVIGSVARRQHG